MTQQHDTDYKYWYSGTGTWDSSTGIWMTEYWLQLCSIHGEVTGKMVDCFMCPIRLALLSSNICWYRQKNWITCVLRTETVTNRCCVNRQINMSYFQQNMKLLKTSFDLLTHKLMQYQWLTNCWSLTAFCCDSFFCCGSCVHSSWAIRFFIWPRKQLLLVN